MQPMYDPEAVKPMEDELAGVGVKPLKTAEEVDAFLQQEGTALVVVNSVCGCAAGSARPGVRMALEHDLRPDRVATVFAGQDLEATARARALIGDVPPSSPSLALLRDGELVDFIPRHLIEGGTAETVARDLIDGFKRMNG